MLDNEADDVENLRNLMKAKKRHSVAKPELNPNLPKLGSDKELSQGEYIP